MAGMGGKLSWCLGKDFEVRFWRLMWRFHILIRVETLLGTAAAGGLLDTTIDMTAMHPCCYPLVSCCLLCCEAASRPIW